MGKGGGTMTFDGSVVKEQGVTFGIVLVKSYVLNSPSDREEMARLGTSAFGMMPIILAAQDSRGRFTYYGRNDIVKFLSNIDPGRIPWKHYTMN